MKKLVISTAVFAALSIAGTTAQAYQFELNGGAGYAYTDIANDNTEGLNVGGSATVYLKNVDSSKGPLAEAAFINQASSIHAGYSYLQTTDLPFFHNTDIKAHALNAGGEFYIPTSLIGLGDTLPVTLYTAGDVTRVKAESSPYNGFNYNAKAGFVVNSLPAKLGTLLLTAGAAGYHDNTDSEVDPTIGAKLLTHLYQNPINLEFNAQFGNDKTNPVFGNKYNIIGGKGDFYVDNTLSVGLGYSRALVNGQHDPFAVNANFRKFLMDNLSIQGGITYAKNGPTDFDFTTAAPTALAIAGLDDNGLGVNGGLTLRF